MKITSEDVIYAINARVVEEKTWSQIAEDINHSKGAIYKRAKPFVDKFKDGSWTIDGENIEIEVEEDIEVESGEPDEEEQKTDEETESTTNSKIKQLKNRFKNDTDFRLKLMWGAVLIVLFVLFFLF